MSYQGRGTYPKRGGMLTLGASLKFTTSIGMVLPAAHMIVRVPQAASLRAVLGFL